MSGKRGVGLLAEIREAGHAGKPLPAEPTRELAAAIDDALITDRTLLEALDLAPTWKAAMARLLRQPAAGSVSARSRDLHADLRRYRDSGRYDEDLVASVKPTGARRALFDLMLSFRGHLPDERTLRRHLTD